MSRVYHNCSFQLLIPHFSTQTMTCVMTLLVPTYQNSVLAWLDGETLEKCGQVGPAGSMWCSAIAWAVWGSCYFQSPRKRLARFMDLYSSWNMRPTCQIMWTNIHICYFRKERKEENSVSELIIESGRPGNIWVELTPLAEYTLNSVISTSIMSHTL